MIAQPVTLDDSAEALRVVEEAIDRLDLEIMELTSRRRVLQLVAHKILSESARVSNIRSMQYLTLSKESAYAAADLCFK